MQPHSWGAVLPGPEGGLHWVEFQEHPGELEVRRGLAEVVEQLPPSGTAALAMARGSLIGNWERALYLLLAAVLMWSAATLRTPSMDLLAFGIPLLGWFAWVKTLGAASALLGGGGPGGGWGAVALTVLLLGLAGLGAQLWARNRELPIHAAPRA